jgi:dihydrofolate reductase
LKRFRALTLGHAVVMGRKTWESLSRALPERQNIVVTRQRAMRRSAPTSPASLDDALALVRLPAPVFCIGGGELFREALGRAQRLYLTEIDRDFSGDATFPPWRRPLERKSRARPALPRAPAASSMRTSPYERTAFTSLSFPRSAKRGNQRMSAVTFTSHGPHDHEVEHAAHSADPFAGRVAVMTAIFATIGALFGYMEGATQNDALMFKNEAAIRRTEASDQWNFYQAKSSKQNLAELGATLTTGEQQARYLKEVERYKKEKDDIMADAKKLERRASSPRKERGPRCTITTAGRRR